MSDGVRETFCTKCLHREVCAYKDTYLRYLETLVKFNNEYSDDISFIKKEDPNCKFFSKKSDSIDALVKAFDEFAVKVKEMADALAEAFGFGPSVSENKRKKRVSVLRLDTECLCRNLEGTPSLSSILTGRLPGNTYLIREEIIENHLYKT